MQIVNVRDVAGEARAIRKRYMLRQDQVARAAGVSRQWISALESGKATLELGLVLRVFDELGLDLIAKRREPPPAWTVPLTDEAEDRERRSITRLRRERMQARSRAWAIRVGNVVPEPGERELDDLDYMNMILEARRRRGEPSAKVKPAKHRR